MGDAYFANIEEREYHEDRSRFSCGFLNKVDKDPRAAQDHWEGKPEGKPTDEMYLGKYGHMRFLEPSSIKSRVARAPNRHQARRAPSAAEKKAAKAEGREPVGKPQDPTPAGEWRTMEVRSDENRRMWDEFETAARGKTIVKPEFEPIISACERAAMNHRRVSRLLTHANMQPEVSVHWTCPFTGMPFKGRYDALSFDEDGECIVELKFTRLVDPRNIGAWAKLGWGRQAAGYLDAYKEVRGRPGRMWWIFIEPVAKDPLIYTCQVTEDHVFAAQGRDGVQGRPEYRGYVELAHWARRCIDTGRWEHPWQAVTDGSMIVPDWFAGMVENNERNAAATAGMRVLGG